MSAVLQQPARGTIALDVPAAEYHRRELGVASNSGLKILLEQTPAHYRAWVEAPEEAETPALAFGRAYHARVLEPDVFARTYAVPPSFGDLRSSTIRARRDAWLAERPGVLLLGADDADRIEAMHAALQAHPVARALMAAGHSEVTLQWTDEESGVACKARADRWIPDRALLVDLKTTDDASPAGFARSVARYGYHQQHAHYCDAMRACGEPVRNYLIVAQEKAAPYAVAVYHIDAAAEARGYELRQQGLALMRQCLDADAWPAYGHRITELALPGWALKDGA